MQTLISKINGVDIITVDRDGEVFVPIKPVCDAIGIDVDAQRNKLNADEFFNSVTAIITATGADGKRYEMYCIRLRDVYGWLATINPGKVAPEAREAVARYRRECYDEIYEYSIRSMQRTIEANNAEMVLLQKINSAIIREKKAMADREEAAEALCKLLSQRYNPSPTLFG